MKKYESLLRKYKNQPIPEIFSHFPWHSGNDEYWETPFEKLANLATTEDWNFKNSKYRRENTSFPILFNYLNFTFLRLQKQDKILYSDDNNRSCFNTGLQTKMGKDIYATFLKSKYAEEEKQAYWTLIEFVDSYSEKLQVFSSLPGIATYINSVDDLVFNLDYDIEINIEHIVDKNTERLPESLQQNKTLATASIVGATKFLKDKIQRNYKIAIPHWYRDSIQLLLPLNITSDTEADLALVADKDINRKIYRIKTALSMDMAYTNARLICRLDCNWLNP